MLGLFSCTKEINYGPVPEITFAGYERLLNSEGKDSLLLLRVNFTDGNGDLGYEEADTIPPYSIGQPFFYNLHVDFYGIGASGKEYFIDNFSNDTIRFNQRVESITPEGKFKSISGTFEIRADYSLLLINGYNPSRVQLEVWINDRALNTSNKVLSPEIDLNLWAGSAIQ